MRRIRLSLFLSAALFAGQAGSLLCASPAYAITQVVGTGTGGNIATGGNNTTNDVTTGASGVDVPIGSLVVIGMAIRSGGSTVSSCVDSVGNAFGTVVNKSAGGNQTNSSIWGISTIDAPIGTTYTCHGTTTLSKSMTVSAWANPAASPLDAATATPTSGTGTAVSVGPTGTLACPGGGANCELLIGMFGHHTIGAVTEDAGFTSLGTNTSTNGNLHMGFKLVSATTAITYAPTAGSSDAWDAQLLAFKGNGAVPPANTPMMMRSVP